MRHDYTETRKARARAARLAADYLDPSHAVLDLALVEVESEPTHRRRALALRRLADRLRREADRLDPALERTPHA